MRLFRKSTVYTVDRLASLFGWVGYGTSSGRTVNEATALEVAAVFCAARVISEGIAQIPVRVMRQQERGGRLVRQVARDHWAHRLLAERPNSWQTSFEFREYAIFSAALCDGFLAVKSMSTNGQVRELLPVPFDAWSVRQNYDYSLEYVVTYADKTTGVFSQSDVMHLRGPSLDGFRGLSAVRLAREAIGLSGALEKQQGRLAGNGGKPSGVLSFAQPLQAETKDKLRQTWQEKFGPNGEGGVAILDGDARFSSMTMTSVDAQHIETRKHQIEEIARAFRVFPQMLMQTDKASTFASAEQFFRAHVIHTLGPWIKRFEETCARDILPPGEALTVDLDERALLRGDFRDQSEYYAKALGAGGHPAWMTQNDVRAELGLNPLDDAGADRLPARLGETQEA